MHRPQLLCPNPGMLYVPLYVQGLVLIAWGRYICMKKKAHRHHLLCKGCLGTLVSHGTYRHMEIL